MIVNLRGVVNFWVLFLICCINFFVGVRIRVYGLLFLLILFKGGSLEMYISNGSKKVVVLLELVMVILIKFLVWRVIGIDVFWIGDGLL